MLKNVTMRK